MKRILVFGGRDFTDMPAVYAALNALYSKHGAFVMVNGMCPTGADQLAAKWARRLDDVPVEQHPADWGSHGRAAGPIRNREMLESGIDAAIQFPGGRGTAHMRSLLDEKQIPVWQPMLALKGDSDEP